MTSAREILQQLQQLDNESSAIKDFNDSLSGTIYGLTISTESGSSTIPQSITDQVMPGILKGAAELVAEYKQKVAAVEARITVADA